MSKTNSVRNMFSPCSELGIFMYGTCNSMNNLMSYYELVDAKIRASDKDLPVHTTEELCFCTFFTFGSYKVLKESYVNYLRFLFHHIKIQLVRNVKWFVEFHAHTIFF